MDLIESLFANMNLWLIVLATGVAVYVVRFLTPDPVEEKKWFRFVITISPIILGAALAVIPGIRPFEELAQCAAAGVIGGSFSSKAYDAVAKLVGDRLKHKLQGRKAPAAVVEDEVV